MQKVRDNSLLGKIKKVSLHIVIMLLAFLIQTSLIPVLHIFECSPNLLLIITFLYGLFHGETIGILTGLICGILYDMYFDGIFGLYILIYSVIGFANGYLHSSFYKDVISFPILLGVINGFIYNFYIYFTHFFIRLKFDIVYYFFNVMVPQVLFIVIATVIIYKLLYVINFGSDT